MNRSNRSLKEFWSVELGEIPIHERAENALIMEEEGYDCTLLMEEVARLVPELNAEQRNVYDVVRNSIHSGSGGFFLCMEVVVQEKPFFGKR